VAECRGPLFGVHCASCRYYRLSLSVAVQSVCCVREGESAGFTTIWLIERRMFCYLQSTDACRPSSCRWTQWRRAAVVSSQYSVGDVLTWLTAW